MLGGNCNVERALKSNNILRFKELVRRKTSLFMFDVYHASLPKRLQSLFVCNRDVLCRSSKFSNNFKVQSCSTHVLSTSLSLSGVRLWNSLPTEIKNTNVRHCNVFSLLILLRVRFQTYSSESELLGSSCMMAYCSCRRGHTTCSK